MKDRERLIELINFAFNGVGAEKNKDKKVAEIVADYLLKHGVILPPCKVGDMLFALWSVPTESKYVIYAVEVVEIRTSKRNCRETTTFLLEPLSYRGRCKEYRIDDFGKLVFTNKEEAEKALKGK